MTTLLSSHRLCTDFTPLCRPPPNEPDTHCAEHHSVVFFFRERTVYYDCSDSQHAVSTLIDPTGFNTDFSVVSRFTCTYENELLLKSVFKNLVTVYPDIMSIINISILHNRTTCVTVRRTLSHLPKNREAESLISVPAVPLLSVTAASKPFDKLYCISLMKLLNWIHFGQRMSTFCILWGEQRLKQRLKSDVCIPGFSNAVLDVLLFNISKRRHLRRAL